MSKCLDALKRIKKETPPYFFILYGIDMWKEDLDTIGKELKALEIIKKKNVAWKYIVMCNSIEEYNESIEFHMEELTQEEYDLLKEVLKNE